MFIAAVSPLKKLHIIHIKLFAIVLLPIKLDSYPRWYNYNQTCVSQQMNVTARSPSASWREVLVPSTGSEVVRETLHRQQIPLTRLRPATTYDLQVQARNQHGWSAVSDMFHFSTLARGEGRFTCPNQIACPRYIFNYKNIQLLNSMLLLLCKAKCIWTLCYLGLVLEYRVS